MPFRAVSRETSTPFGAVLHSNRCGGRCCVGAGAGSGLGGDFGSLSGSTRPGAASLAAQTPRCAPRFWGEHGSGSEVPRRARDRSTSWSRPFTPGGCARLRSPRFRRHRHARTVCTAVTRQMNHALSVMPWCGVSSPALGCTHAGGGPLLRRHPLEHRRLRRRPRPRPRPRPLYRGPHARSGRTAVTHHPVRHVMCGLGSSSPSL